jgi:8-oxo-dGTP diphosphatase
VTGRVFLVRHAKAGSRSAWQGDDDERPLTKSGHAQAKALADRLDGEGVTSLLSSPTLRCVQTLEPLAERVGSTVQIDKRLAEGTPFEQVLVLLEEVEDGAALCSHGDVIPEVIDALIRRGLEVTTEPQWRKGSVWILARDGDRFVSAAAEQPLP